MRDLGRELGLLGSSLYSHVGSKQDLLVEVVRRGDGLFRRSLEQVQLDAGPADRLRSMIGGHIDVVLDHRDEVRTFLNEARSLDQEHRSQVIAARDRYEAAFRSVLKDGVADGTFRDELDPAFTAIFILSILNTLERWYRLDGPVDRPQLVERVMGFVMNGVRQPSA